MTSSDTLPDEGREYMGASASGSGREARRRGSAVRGEDRFGDVGRAKGRLTNSARRATRLAKAVKLREAGLTRAQIAIALDMKPEGVKELFRSRPPPEDHHAPTQ